MSSTPWTSPTVRPLTEVAHAAYGLGQYFDGEMDYQEISYTG